MSRRLQKIKKEKREYQDRLDKAKTISECLIYRGKLESLEREEKEILARYE